MNKYLLIGFILAVLTIAGLYLDRQHQKDEKMRYKSNFEVSQTDLLFERTKSGLKSARIDALELDRSEIKNEFSQVNDALKDMSIQIKRLQSYTSTSTETVYNFETTFKDTLVRDTVRIEKLDYHTEWIDLEVWKDGVNARVQIHSRDSLIQVVYWERTRKFLFFKYGRKRFSQKIRSSNPDSDIKYSEFILPKKR